MKSHCTSMVHNNIFIGRKSSTKGYYDLELYKYLLNTHGDLACLKKKSAEQNVENDFARTTNIVSIESREYK